MNPQRGVSRLLTATAPTDSRGRRRSRGRSDRGGKCRLTRRCRRESGQATATDRTSISMGRWRRSTCRADRCRDCSARVPDGSTVTPQFAAALPARWPLLARAAARRAMIVSRRASACLGGAEAGLAAMGMLPVPAAAQPRFMPAMVKQLNRKPIAIHMDCQSTQDARDGREKARTASSAPPQCSASLTMPSATRRITGKPSKVVRNR
jgi:hypothetical protein